MSKDELLEQARHGDRVALGRLLMLYDLRLRRRIARQIPADIQSAVSPEDVLQETYTQAYRHVGNFEPRGKDSFYHWLAAIADHKLIDAIKALRAAKRPPPHRARCLPGDRSSSFLALAELADKGGQTPSGIMAKKEAMRAVQVALAALPESCRQAVWMRHIEGRSVREVAAALGRTERAVQQLCYRGLLRLRAEMATASKFLSNS